MGCLKTDGKYSKDFFVTFYDKMSNTNKNNMK